MQKDKEIRDFFKESKKDIPDAGFTRQVMARLPGRSPVLPRVIVAVCTVAGIICVITIQGFSPFMEQIVEFATSLGRFEMPSLTSLSAYLTALILMGSVGYAVSTAGR